MKELKLIINNIGKKDYVIITLISVSKVKSCIKITCNKHNQ